MSNYDQPVMLMRDAKCVEGEVVVSGDTEFAAGVCVDYAAADAIGVANVQAFATAADCTEAGVVLRLRITGERALLPVVVSGPDGVDIHLCGRAEAAAMLTAIRGTLAALREVQK